MKITQIILSLLFTFLVLNACKKTFNTYNINDKITNNQEETHINVDETAIYNKLIGFKYSRQNKSFETEPQTIDSARWYVETYFNVNKARTEEVFKLERKDSTFYTVDVNKEGLIEFSAMNALYNEMLQDLDSLESVIANPNILPVYADLDVMNSSEANVTFRLMLGFGGTLSGNYEPITADDDWRWGNMQGHCDGTNFGESDAGQELKRRLNNPYFAYSPGSFIEYIPPISVYYSEYPDVNNHNPDPNIGYMIYYETGTTWGCIEDDELNYYLNRAHEIFYTFNNQYLPNTNLYGKRPVGKHFVDMDIWTPNGTNWWEHRYYLRYATRVNLPIIE